MRIRVLQLRVDTHYIRYWCRNVCPTRPLEQSARRFERQDPSGRLFQSLYSLTQTREISKTVGKEIKRSGSSILIFRAGSRSITGWWCSRARAALLRLRLSTLSTPGFGQHLCLSDFIRPRRGRPIVGTRPILHHFDDLCRQARGFSSQGLTSCT